MHRLACVYCYQVNAFVFVPVGWINPEQQCDVHTHSVLKCEQDRSGEIKICKSLRVCSDMSWEVTVRGYKILCSCDILSSLP